MSEDDLINSLSADSLRDLLRRKKPSAILVAPRILRRVVRLDRRLSTIGGRDCKAYPISRERLLAFADFHELELVPGEPLPDHVILLAQVGEDEPVEIVTREQTLRYYWRNLFRAAVQMDLEQLAAERDAADEMAADRCQQIGEAEFAEIRAVLQKDDFLFPQPTDWDVYVEFVATCLDLRYFAEQDLPWFFPAIRDWQKIERMISSDVDHKVLLDSTRLPGSGPPIMAEIDESPMSVPLHDIGDDMRRRSKRTSLLKRAQRAASAGNDIKAAILLTRLSPTVPPAEQAPICDEADQSLEHFVARLQPVLALSADAVNDWFAALKPLLAPAASSRQFWSAEARLLYDLQKVCVEHERGVFYIRWPDWIRSATRRPVRHPLPLLRQVLIAKHLRSAARRLPGTRIGIAARDRLSEMLASKVAKVDYRTRNQIRPLILDVLNDVGLKPANVPEKVAQRYVIEELLDRIVEKGAINLGNLRDALSKSDLKLPDLDHSELIRGDRLLRADRRLGNVLDGVYRPGAIYLRSAQRLSSLVFGTRLGRFATRYVLLPYGGAYLAVEGVRHLTALFIGKHPSPAAVSDHVWTDHDPLKQFSLLAFAIVGTWLLLLIHWPRFRRWSLELLRFLGRVLRSLLVELPARLVKLPWVRNILDSPVYVAVRSYVIQPLIVTILVAFMFRLIQLRLAVHLQIEIFLGLTIFLNSPLGRFCKEWLGDVLRRTWNDLRFRIFSAIFHWIMDAFQRWMANLEQFVYTVDELLRFRAGDNRQIETAKLLAGTCWSLVAYVLVFVFTLLVEPQINPIKHFPVVTVSHKLMLPAGPTFVDQFTPYIGKARANTLVWSTIWLIPGVFGFLVWELKENWRLYASNRPQNLLPFPFGHHGETMVRLLRPGIHSGTLPKLFFSARKALRKAQLTGHWKGARQVQNRIHHSEEAVRRFLEREFLVLLELADFPTSWIPHVQRIHVATNRTEAFFRGSDWFGPECRISWTQVESKLTGRVEGDLETGRLSDAQRQCFHNVLTALFQRTGVERVDGSIEIAMSPPMAWDHWVAIWSAKQESDADGRRENPSDPSA